MIKKGFITLGIAVAVGIVSAFSSSGWGPCGPASITDLVLFLGVGFAFLVGVGMIIVGVILRYIRNGRSVGQPTPPSS